MSVVHFVPAPVVEVLRFGRRIHPRHTTQTVSVRPRLAASGWAPVYGPAAVVKAQVEHTQELVHDSAGTRVVQLLKLRVPPSSRRDVVALFPAESEVTYKGAVSFVLAARAVLRHARPVYIEVLTGELPARGAGVTVTAVIHHQPGLDRRGDPLPGTGDVTVENAWFVPGATSEPVDASDSAVSTGTLQVPSLTSVKSTDRVTLSGHSALGGSWQVDGDPLPAGDRLDIPLRRL